MLSDGDLLLPWAMDIGGAGVCPVVGQAIVGSQEPDRVIRRGCAGGDHTRLEDFQQHAPLLKQGISTRSTSRASPSPGRAQKRQYPVSSVSSAASGELELVLSLQAEGAASKSQLQEMLGPKRRSFKRSRTAEEKAARVRARNRRAQQAFRSRQKAVSAERADFLSKLQNDVDQLRRENEELRSEVQVLTQHLHDLRAHTSEVRFAITTARPAHFEYQKSLSGAVCMPESPCVSGDWRAVSPLLAGMIPNELSV